MKVCNEIKTDTQMTGKLYPKLNAYFVDSVIEGEKMWEYLCSSVQFKTMKKFKAFLECEYVGFEISVNKGE